MADDRLKIEMTPELIEYMNGRRDMYLKYYPEMTQKERVDLLQQDLIEESFRRKGQTVYVEVE